MNTGAELAVYSRRGCHLCELLLEQLEPMVRRRARIVVHDVDAIPDWCERFGARVPVVCAGDTELCQYRLDRDAITAWLSGLPSD